MELLTNVFRQLLSMAAMALPVMALVLLFRLCLRKAPKKYSYTLWLVVGLRLVCPLLPESPVGLPQPEAVEETVSAVMPARTSQAAEAAAPEVTDRGGETAPAVSPEFVPEQAAPAAQTPPASVAPAASARRSVGWMGTGALVWAAGLAGALAYIAVSDIRLRRRVAQAVRREDNVWECDGIPTPFVLGLFRPRVYVPFRMTEAQRVYVLAHERHHIRRRDHWAKALALVLLAVYWWDPAVWLCWRLFCRDMEMSCDEAVLAKLGSQARREYSLSLVSFALDRQAPMALAFGEHDAARRVKNVLGWKEARPAVTFLALAAVVLVTVVCGTDAPGGWVRTTEGDETLSVTYHLSRRDAGVKWYLDIYKDGVISDSRFLGSGRRLPQEGTVSIRYETAAETDHVIDSVRLWAEGETPWAYNLSLENDWLLEDGDSAYIEAEPRLESARSTVPRDGLTVYTLCLSESGKFTEDTMGNSLVLQVRLVMEKASRTSGGAVRLTGTVQEDTGTLNYRFGDSVGSYGISMETWYKGELVSPPSLRIFDDVGGGMNSATLSSGSFQLSLEFTEAVEDVGFIMEKGGVTMTLHRILNDIPFPECNSVAWVWLEGDVELDADGSAVIGAVYYGSGDGLDAYTCDTYQERYPAEVLKDSEYTILLRLVVSQGNKDRLEADLERQIQAQTLMNLRVDSARDTGDVRMLLEALGASRWGAYQVSGGRDQGKTRVRVAFEEDHQDDPVFTEYMEAVGSLLQALVEDAEVAEYTTGEVTSSLFANSPAAEWAGEQGYGDLKKAASTVEGMMALLDYLEWDREDTLDELARTLYALKDDPGSLLWALDTESLGDYTVEWLDSERVQVNFVTQSVDAETLRSGMEQRGTLLLAVDRELAQVNWSYEVPGGRGGTSGATGYMDRPGADWTIRLGTATVSEEAAVQGIRTLLDDLGWGLPISAASLPVRAKSMDRISLIRELMERDDWQDAVELPCTVSEGNRAVYVDILETPEDPDALDAAMVRRGMLMLYLKPNTESLRWSYPAKGGRIVSYTVDEKRLSYIIGLFSNYEAAQTWPVMTEAELDRLVQSMDLDDEVYLMARDDPAGLAAEPFADILGYAGQIRTEATTYDWSRRVYYAVTEEGAFPIAESFGWGEPRDYTVDLDGDGREELVCGVTFNADGAQRVIVYQRRGDEILQSWVTPEGLPGYEDTGVGSHWEEYDPGENLFRIHYHVKGQEDYAVAEVRGMSQLEEFYPYA